MSSVEREQKRKRQEERERNYKNLKYKILPGSEETKKKKKYEENISFFLIRTFNIRGKQ